MGLLRRLERRPNNAKVGALERPAPATAFFTFWQHLPLDYCVVHNVISFTSSLKFRCIKSLGQTLFLFNLYNILKILVPYRSLIVINLRECPCLQVKW